MVDAYETQLNFVMTDESDLPEITDLVERVWAATASVVTEDDVLLMRVGSGLKRSGMLDLAIRSRMPTGRSSRNSLLVGCSSARTAIPLTRDCFRRASI